MRFMGRYSEPLRVLFADLPEIRPGQRVVDVGCGPGALIAELVSRAATVSAVEPSAFARRRQARLPGADVRSARPSSYTCHSQKACTPGGPCG